MYNIKPVRKMLDKSLKKLEAKTKLLETEIELLTTNKILTKKSFNPKFEIIKYTICKYNLKGVTTYLCNYMQVSKSGYYNYLNNEKKRENNEIKDRKDFELILKAYKFKRRNKGARQIKMVLQNEFNIIFNIKKIRRLMKKYNLECPTRRKDPYKELAKKKKENNLYKNIVNRLFKPGIPYNVLLTDITYLFYGKGKKCYLSTIKDSQTNEILAYHISKTLKIELSLNTIKKLVKEKHIFLNEKVIMHSDQGIHYTSKRFHNLLKKHNITQSMSRRGNCWDNAPQESFFGHMKDELNLDICFSFHDVCLEIKDYIYYYNNYRYQWNLDKLTPVKYRNKLLEAS